MNTKTIIPIICALAALPACADKPENNYTVYVDPAFDSATQQVILDGLNNWQTRVWNTGHMLWLNPIIGTHDCSHGCDDIIVIHASNMAAVAALAHDSDGDGPDGITFRSWREDPTTGHYWDWSNVFLAADMRQSDIHNIVLHEVGHALALQHTPPGQIMCWSTECESADITQDDINQYLTLRGEK